MSGKTTKVTKVPAVNSGDRASLQRLAEVLRVRQRYVRQAADGRWQIEAGNRSLDGGIISGGSHGGYLIRVDGYTVGVGGRSPRQNRWMDQLKVFCEVTSDGGTSWAWLREEPTLEQAEVIRGVLQLPRVPEWEPAEAA